MVKKMNTALERAMSNRTRHNQRMQDEIKKVEAEAEIEDEKNAELLALLTATEPTERPTQPVLLPGGIRVNAYTTLTGAQEALLGKINSIATSAEKGVQPDIGGLIDATIDLAASLIVPEPGRDWDNPETWRIVHAQCGLEKVMEIIGTLLEPYRETVKQSRKFRQQSGRAGPGRTV
jgi:hypothetical protein